jgi:integrase
VCTPHRSRGEAIGATWSEFDLGKAEWSLPASHSKNGLAHVIPLSADAVRVLRAQEQTSVWVFPSEKAGGPLRHDRLTKLLREALTHYVDDLGTLFTPHDLRRTVETGLARLGIGREVRDRILNHKDRSVSGMHYNRHDYLPEKRAALEKWAREVRRVTSGEKAKVVPIRRSRGL